MDLKMWVKAIKIIPRLDKEEWDKSDMVSKWLISTRSAVLVMTMLSAAIGGIFSLIDGKFDLPAFLVCFIGLTFAHATNNLLNDLVDYVKGVDKENYYRTQYGPQPLENGFLPLKKYMFYIFFTGLIALSCGVYLIWLRGLAALILFLMGSFFLLFYTWPLKYFGLGEFAVIAVWGPLMIGGTYFVTANEWSWRAVLGGLPYALGVTTVLFGKHIDKLEADKLKGINTLPVIIGESAARKSVLIMTLLQYLIVIALVIAGVFHPVLLITLIALKTFYGLFKAYSKELPEEKPEGYRSDIWPLWFVAFAFDHNKKFGGLFLLGLIVQLILSKL
ncbi:MAG: prenyltransferase [Candidatus Firestonebacteria bacterium]